MVNGSKNDAMSILILSRRLLRGGLSGYAFDLARAWRHAGHRVRMLTTPTDAMADEADRLRSEGIEVELQDKLTPRAIAHVAQGADFVKLVTGSFPPDTRLRSRMMLHLRTRRTPVIETLHMHASPTVRWSRRLLYRVDRRPYGLCVFTDAMRDEVIQSLPELTSAIDVVPSGVRLSLATSARTPPAGSFRLVTVTRLEESVKDTATLLRAVRVLIDLGLQCSLRIVGDGGDRATLQSLADEIGVASAVEFLGWVPDVRRVYDEADVFVLSTRTESFGRVNIEAASRGLPVVASDVVGCRLTVEHEGNGMLVTPGDPGALADNLRAVIESGDVYERMSARSIEVAERFTMHRHAEALLTAAKKLITH